MQIGLSINYQLGSTNGDFFIKLFDRYVRYTPDRFSIKMNGSNWKVSNWSNKHSNEIKNSGYLDEIIASFNENLFMVVNTGTMTPHQSILISQHLNIPFIEQEIESCLEQNGLMAVYLYDAIYVEVQSTVYEGNISGRDYSMESIKNTPFTFDKYTGGKEYDISFNPGRDILIGHTHILAAWKMWYGEDFYKIVPKDHILNFPNAYRIEELDKGRVFIQLFEKIEESDSEENMQNQRKWLDWINVNNLIEIYQ